MGIYYSRNVTFNFTVLGWVGLVGCEESPWVWLTEWAWGVRSLNGPGELTRLGSGGSGGSGGFPLLESSEEDMANSGLLVIRIIVKQKSEHVCTGRMLPLQVTLLDFK